MSKRHITDFFTTPSCKKKSHQVDVAPERISSPITPAVHGPSSSTAFPANVSNAANIFGTALSSPSKTISSDATSVSSSQKTAGKNEFYKGYKLDKLWLLNSFPSVLEKVKIGKRSGLKCMVCFRQLNEAKKLSRNGKLPIADGVRCDGTKELERIIDHLLGEPHQAALKADEAQELWLKHSEQHPWFKVLKSHESQIVCQLIEMAIDVYNDSRQLTLSANSWPSRSLSKIHSDSQIATYREHGLDSTFTEFNPPASVYHYRNPSVYREMLDVVAEKVMSPVLQRLKAADCFSLQVDGSVDKYCTDNIFITARYVTKSSGIKNIFLGESFSDKRGAEGLLDAVVILLKSLNLEETAKQGLTGITTDGESANTGKNSGLWALLKTFLGKDILTISCVAHRSDLVDLVYADLEAMVAEVKHWRLNIKSVATYYRTSSVRTEELNSISKELGIKCYRFPAYFEVRFVEHLVNLSESVLKNLSAIRKHWNSIIDSEFSNRVDKATARGFLKVWISGGEQEYFTALMIDILRLIRNLQKDFQKSMSTLCDIEVSKKIALSSLNLMAENPLAGGEEEKLSKQKQTDDAGEDDDDNRKNRFALVEGKRKAFNSLVTSKRCKESVRNEIILSTKEFLTQRVADEQEQIVKILKKFLHASSPTEMIACTRDVVENLFGSSNVEEFRNDVIGHFVSGNLSPSDNLLDDGGKLFHFLKISVPGSVFSKLVQAYIGITPHSAGPERTVSCHTTLKSSKQSCYSREAINSRMYIALNGNGTANFDPRPAVAAFLQKKERRYNEPDRQLYRDRDFIKTFFAEENSI